MRTLNTRQNSGNETHRCVTLLFLVPLLLCNVTSGLAAEYITYTNPAEYEETQSIVVHNHDITALTSLELNLPIPRHWPELSISDITIEGDNPFYLENTEGPGKVVRSIYRGGKLPRPNEKRTLKASYHVIVKEIKTRKDILAGMTYPPYLIDDEYSYYTAIEPDPRIVEIVDKIKKKTDAPYHLAKSAYDYVIDNMTYSETYSSEKWLAEKRGDCSKFTQLFVDICRTAGMPARPIAGYLCKGDNRKHCWAEFMLPAVGWIPADPTIGQENAAKRKYYFGNLDNNHLPVAKTFKMKFQTFKGSKKNDFIQVGYWSYYYVHAGNGANISAEFSMHGEKTTIDNLVGTPDYSRPVDTQLREALRKKKQGDFYGAIQICLGVIKNTKTENKYLARAYYRLGMCYLEIADNNKAAEKLKFLIANFPEQQSLLTKAKKELKKIEPSYSH